MSPYEVAGRTALYHSATKLDESASVEEQLAEGGPASRSHHQSLPRPLSLELIVDLQTYRAIGRGYWRSSRKTSKGRPLHHHQLHSLHY